MSIEDAFSKATVHIENIRDYDCNRMGWNLYTSVFLTALKINLYVLSFKTGKW